MQKVYNKLVRDKIPYIIEKQGKICTYKSLSKTEYLKLLNNKLQEELNEYLESFDLEELIDLEEIIRAIIKLNDLDYEDFDKLRQEKVNTNGAFANRIFLESVEE